MQDGSTGVNELSAWHETQATGLCPPARGKFRWCSSTVIMGVGFIVPFSHPDTATRDAASVASRADLRSFLWLSIRT